jgi:glycosyltransferase involved in cell wall biosynthesis
MRLALVGHACSPTMGSEPGTTWNWAKNLSRYHEVLLFTHPQFRADIDAELKQNPIPSMTVDYVEVAGPMDPWNPARGEGGIRVHYRMWQHRVLTHVREAHAVRPFDLVHHVSWGSLLQPPQLWRLGCPLIWGPIGGGQIWPRYFGKYRSWGFAENFRSFMVRMARFNPAVLAAVRHADIIFTGNRETDERVRRLGGRRVEPMFDIGIDRSLLAETPLESCSPPGTLNVFWGGRLEPRKGLALGIEALAQTRSKEIRLVVAGDGPSRRNCEQLAVKLGVADRVKFLGKLPRADLMNLFRSSDALLFTSLRDSTGAIVFEAMAKALPIVTLDHQGIGMLVTEEMGIKVAVTRPKQTIAELAQALDRLAADPQLRRQMSAASLRLASNHLWDRRVLDMNRWYEEVLGAHRRS